MVRCHQELKNQYGNGNGGDKRRATAALQCKLSGPPRINGIHAGTGWPYARTFGEDTCTHTHTHTHFMAATVSSQVTQGSAPMCHPSVCWSVWIRSQRETMKLHSSTRFYFFMCMFFKRRQLLMEQAALQQVEKCILHLCCLSSFLRLSLVSCLSLAPFEKQRSPLASWPPLLLQKQEDPEDVKRKSVRIWQRCGAFNWSLKLRNNHITLRRQHTAPLESMQRQKQSLKYKLKSIFYLSLFFFLLYIHRMTDKISQCAPETDDGKKIKDPGGSVGFLLVHNTR